jgi:hypothetical protein
MKKLLCLASFALVQTSILGAKVIDTIQPPPTVTIVNISSNGPSVGDMQTFEAPIYESSTNGKIVTLKMVGEVSAVRTLIEPNSNMSWLRSNSVVGYTNGAIVDQYSQSMTFYFSGKGTIQVLGERFVTRANTNGVFALPLIGLAQKLPIVGGTDTYEYARGQISLEYTTNAFYPNGCYLQHFEFKQ